MMDEITQEQQAYIEKLAKEKAIYDKIREKDAKGMVINFEEREKLDELARRTDKVLQKLKSREFTVAVVGLEKAGKSTLGNAILKLDALPEYTERCTYTTTEIRAGSENMAEVFFYTQDEFNARLKDMLNELKFPHPADLNSLTHSLFDAYWERQREENPPLYQMHNGTIAEDVRAIIDNKEVIRQYLGAGSKQFAEGELKTQAFKQFITGISGFDSDHTVIRTGHPYAVKSVIIKSQNLSEMRNIVLYDVPGFDSPTKLHKEQTEQMLKEADAIILVTNVGDRPNLVGTQLDMLHRVRDDDNIRLSEKAFVFGNKIDRAGNARVAKDNEAALRKDVRRYELAKDAHVFCGSAKGYLEKQGIGSSDERMTGDNSIMQTLQSWGMDDGIEKLKASMQDYYNHDRFTVLKERAERSTAATEKFLEEILGKFTPDVLGTLDLGHNLVLELKDSLGTFVQRANKIREEVKTQYWQEMPFSTTVENNIETIYPNVDRDSDLLDDINLSGDVDQVDKLQATEGEIRQQLQVKFLSNIVTEMATMTRDREQAINDKLVATFLDAMGMPANCPDKDKLTGEVQALFDKVLIAGGDHCRFNSLVERFSTSLVEALIGHPFGSEERYTKVSQDDPPHYSRQEFLSLAIYYRDPEKQMDDRIVKELSIFSRILLHRDTQRELYRENEQGIREVANKNHQLQQGADLAANLIPFWAKLLVKAGVHLKDQADDMEKRFGTVTHRSDWSSQTKEEKAQLLDDMLNQYCHNHSFNANLDMTKELEKMQKEARVSVQIDSMDKVFAVLNEDIDILRDITVHSVRYAMGLERAFISVISKNIDIINKSISDNPKLYNDWIARNVSKIRASEYAHIAQSQEDNMTRKEIVKAIQQLLQQKKTEEGIA